MKRIELNNSWKRPLHVYKRESLRAYGGQIAPYQVVFDTLNSN